MHNFHLYRYKIRKKKVLIPVCLIPVCFQVLKALAKVTGTRREKTTIKMDDVDDEAGKIALHVC